MPFTFGQTKSGWLTTGAYATTIPSPNRTSPFPSRLRLEAAGGLEDAQARGARLDYQEIRLRWEWEELLDLVRAQRAILDILEMRDCDPNSGARELLRMELESFERLLAPPDASLGQ